MAETNISVPHAANSTDFDLHGVVGIRLINASESDSAAVGRQLGRVPAPLSREPDITVRFVDKIDTAGPVRLLGSDEAGFTDDAFLVVRSKHRTGVRVQIPFDRVGGRCDIVCETGVPAVPLLVPIMNLTALAKGTVALHASAFHYGGQGVLCTGWSKGGKTETLLAFMARGAEYIGDEWVYISRDGSRMFGIPEPIRLWDWHLKSLPEFRRRIGRGRRVRLRILRMLHTMGEWSGMRSLERYRLVLKRQLYADVTPQRLFGPACKMAGSFDQLVLVASHDSPDVSVQRIEPEEVAQRMQFSLHFERRDFLAFYQMFRFAFPELENPFIEQASELERATLLRVFAGKPTSTLVHPYPVSIPALFDALAPRICAAAKSSEPAAAERRQVPLAAATQLANCDSGQFQPGLEPN